MNDRQLIKKCSNTHKGQIVLDMSSCLPMTNDVLAALAHLPALTATYSPQQKPALERFHQKLNAHFLEHA